MMHSVMVVGADGYLLYEPPKLEMLILATYHNLYFSPAFHIFPSLQPLEIHWLVFFLRVIWLFFSTSTPNTHPCRWYLYGRDFQLLRSKGWGFQFLFFRIADPPRHFFFMTMSSGWLFDRTKYFNPLSDFEQFYRPCVFSIFCLSLSLFNKPYYMHSRYYDDYRIRPHTPE